jgi:hypothetical protein
VDLYGGHSAKNVENAWQYAKVYQQHMDELGLPNNEYFEWARKGWSSQRADRYPMGKGAKPEYSWWDGARLDYVSARKAIYIPIYSRAVAKTPSWEELKHRYDSGKELWLWDFDGYDHVKHGIALKDAQDLSSRKMGHAFVLAMMLEGLLPY